MASGAGVVLASIRSLSSAALSSNAAATLGSRVDLESRKSVAAASNRKFPTMCYSVPVCPEFITPNVPFSSAEGTKLNHPAKSLNLLRLPQPR